MERGSREHLAAFSGKKEKQEKPETAALRAKLAEAQVRDTMNKLVEANAEQMKAYGWSGKVEKPIPPPPIPEAPPVLQKKRPRRQGDHSEQIAA